MGTVTILGDNPEFKYLMQRYVRRTGHRAVLVASHGDLLTAIRHERPVAIILEADLCQVSERTMLMRTLTSDRLTRDVPLVVCSWLDEKVCSSQRDEVIYLRKPILYGDLVSALTDGGVGVCAEDSVDRPDGESWRDPRGGAPRR
jgi:CheY-like chemotaxis protein